MTSSNEKIFRVTGHLYGEFTGPRWSGPTQRPVTRNFDVFFDLGLNKRLSKRSWRWWFETLSRPLWRHLNDPDSKVHGANMGPTGALSVPDGPHVGPVNLAIRVVMRTHLDWLREAVLCTQCMSAAMTHHCWNVSIDKATVKPLATWAEEILPVSRDWGFYKIWSIRPSPRPMQPEGLELPTFSYGGEGIPRVIKQYRFSPHGYIFPIRWSNQLNQSMRLIYAPLA